MEREALEDLKTQKRRLLSSDQVFTSQDNGATTNSSVGNGTVGKRVKFQLGPLHYKIDNSRAKLASALEPAATHSLQQPTQLIKFQIQKQSSPRISHKASNASAGEDEVSRYFQVGLERFERINNCDYNI